MEGSKATAMMGLTVAMEGLDSNGNGGLDHGSEGR
jgi:hypothetical protein